MKWAVLIVRTLLGLVFLVFGLAYFLVEMPKPELSELAAGYVGALGSTGYMTVIKVLEITGGLLLVSGRFVPLGITLLTPVIVNILLFEIFLAHQPGFGVAMSLMAVFLIAGYWKNFRPVFAPNAEIGCGC
ncbi:MAG: hypothetical protein J2P46_14200 [Zavarzinella sp.]|nr:hypothetical protein [Zavarzinella sp.]